MTKIESLKMYDSKWYEIASDLEIVSFQLYEDRLCMPFNLFHQYVEKILKRPVWTHEFAEPQHLRREFEDICTKEYM